MCEEILRIVKKMDLSNIEVRLALQCAPLIVGIKVSNLFTISSDEGELVSQILNGTGIEYYRLCQHGARSTYLLFRREEFVFRDILSGIQEQYVDYIKYGAEFPHEIGIVLGYPKEDVRGFIENKGKNYLYSGYWKVYADVEDKKLLFDAYESAKEGLILLVANGYDMHSIIQYFDTHRY